MSKALPRALFGIPRLPSFMVITSSMDNGKDSGSREAVFSAKWVYPANSKFRSIGRGDNNGFPTLNANSPKMSKLFCAHRLSAMSKAHLFDGFRRRFHAKMLRSQLFTRLRRGFLAEIMWRSAARNRIAKHKLSLFLKSRRGLFLASLRLPISLVGFRRAFHAQTRASNTINVETALSKRVEGVKEVLFTRRQHLRKQHQFQDFEGESVKTILIPGILQVPVMVDALSESIPMGLLAHTQVYRAANVELAGNGTGDLVNARCAGDSGRIHDLNRLLFSALLLFAVRMQGYISSGGVITPSLDSDLSIHSF